VVKDCGGAAITGAVGGAVEGSAVGGAGALPGAAVGGAGGCLGGVACGVVARALHSEVVEGGCGVALGGRDTIKIIRRPAQTFLNSLADSVGL
jgi:hypothetical protein